MQGATSFIIIVVRLDIFPKIALILFQRFHIIKHWTTLSKNFLSLLLIGRTETWKLEPPQNLNSNI